MTSAKGIVAAGHPATAEVARQILSDGGNAFDAVVGAAMAACVAEPLLASLGGGGFLLAREAEGGVRLFDFFGQTPGEKNPTSELAPIDGDFGATTQQFHIGMGTAAVPGMVDGMFTIIAQLARMSAHEILEPARRLAIEGVAVNRFQHSIAEILAPIVEYRPELKRDYYSDGVPINVGQRQPFPALASTFDALVSEGPSLFYRGEIAERIGQLARDHAGHLREADLAAYQTLIRAPLASQFAGAVLYANPVPSCGGTLIAHALSAFERTDPSAPIADRLLLAQRATQLARHRSELQRNPRPAIAAQLLELDAIESLVVELADRPVVSRGTTQISVADAAGNLASMTLSNGEGNGYLVPGTGIHLNNYLGEQDLNPAGIGNWPPDRRLSSMMSPTLVQSGATWLALGSGGSNRIRSAISNTLIHRLANGKTLEQAIEMPRLHLEGDLLSTEPGAETRPGQLRHQAWAERNVFFGGVHAVEWQPKQFFGHGDSRRGGVALLA